MIYEISNIKLLGTTISRGFCLSEVNSHPFQVFSRLSSLLVCHSTTATDTAITYEKHFDFEKCFWSDLHYDLFI